MKRFKIGDRVYDFEEVSKLTLKDLLVLERQTEELGRRIDMNDVEDLQNRISKMTPAELRDEPDVLLYFAVGVWAARVHAGEDITFADAINFPMADLTILPDPKDRQPRKAPDPTRARQDGARAARRTPVAAASRSASRSKKASTAG